MSFHRGARPLVHLQAPAGASISIETPTGPGEGDDISEATLQDLLNHNALVLTNRSGAARSRGDVVILDTSADASFTTTTTASLSSVPIGVLLEDLADGASGLVALGGYVGLINLGGGAPTRGHYLFTSTTAGQGATSATRAAGAFGQVVTDDADSPAVLWGQPDDGGGAGSILATIGDAKGDLIGFSAADTPVRVPVGADGKFLVADSSEASGLGYSTPAVAGFVGCIAFHTLAQNIGDATVTTLLFNNEVEDTHAIHSTVTNVGRFIVPTGKGGKWRCACVIFVPTLTGGGNAQIIVQARKNLTTDLDPSERNSGSSSNSTSQRFDEMFQLAAGDIIEFRLSHGNGVTLAFGHSSVPSARNYALFQYMGA